jgi:hypothetical protein
VDKFYTVYQNITKILNDELVANNKISDAIPKIERKISLEFSRFGDKIEIEFIQNRKNNISISGVYFSDDKKINLYVPMFVDPVWRKEHIITKLISTIIHEFIHSRQEISAEYFKSSYIQRGRSSLKQAKYMFQDLEFQPWIQGTILRFIDVPEGNFNAFVDSLITEVPEMKFSFLGPDSQRQFEIVVATSKILQKFNIPKDPSTTNAVSNLIDVYNTTFQIGNDELKSRATSWIKVIKKEFKLFQIYRRRFG